MKIQDINAYLLKIPLTCSWAIAYSTDTDCETVITEIITDEGLRGYGEAAPFSPVTGDTPKTILAVLEELKLKNEYPYKKSWKYKSYSN